jgi:hypothetical protein
MRPRAAGVATGIRGVTTRVAIGIIGVTTRIAIGIIGVTVRVGVPALPVIPMPLNHWSGPYVWSITARVAAGVTARAAAAGVAVSIISVIARVCRILRILRILRISRIIEIGALCGCGSGNRTEQSSADKRDVANPRQLTRRDDRRLVHDGLSCATHFAGVESRNNRQKWVIQRPHLGDLRVRNATHRVGALEPLRHTTANVIARPFAGSGNRSEFNYLKLCATVVFIFCFWALTIYLAY